MDLTKFKFPEVTQADLAFPTFKTDPELLEEAKKRGFYQGSTKYNKIFSTIFYSGGKLVFKEKLDEGFRKPAWAYLRSFMRSLEPKHEEKEAISALILSELVEEIEKEPAS